MPPDIDQKLAALLARPIPLTTTLKLIRGKLAQLLEVEESQVERRHLVRYVLETQDDTELLKLRGITRTTLKTLRQQLREESERS